MTMLCQWCGKATRVLDTIGENTTDAMRAKRGSNVGVVRVRECGNGHSFETIEIRRIAYDVLVAS